jgi:chemotaxis protein CheZ
MPERAPDGSSPSQPDAPRKVGLAEAYAALEALLCASPKGRWFLAEFARRNRAAGRIERAVLKPSPRHAAPDNVFIELVEMSEAIARTRREIAQIKPSHKFDEQLVGASAELEHIVEATEKATSDILGAAEVIQEVAWMLRERGTEVELCDKLDQRATDIYTACSFQDITGQRTEKVVKALRFIEQRINAMIEIWGVDDIAFRVDDIAAKMKASADVTVREDDRLLHGPQRKGAGLKQAEVDRMLTGRDARARAAATIASASLQEGAAPPGTASSAPASKAFDRPEPLTFAELDAIKRAALFG